MEKVRAFLATHVSAVLIPGFTLLSLIFISLSPAITLAHVWAEQHMPTSTHAPNLSHSLEIISKVGILCIREILERVRVPDFLGPCHVGRGGTDRRSLRGLRGETPLFVVASREDDASDGEGDVEEHVEAEVGGESLVVARRIAALEYLQDQTEC